MVCHFAEFQQVAHAEALAGFPFVAVGINAIAVFQIYVQVRNLMDIRLKKKVGIQIIVERNPRTVFAAFAGEVTNFGASAFGNLEFERALLPKLKAIFHRCGRNMRFKDLLNRCRGHIKKRL